MVYIIKLHVQNSKDKNVTVQKCVLCVRGIFSVKVLTFSNTRPADFSAVLNACEARVPCSFAASMGWSVHQTNITQAFMSGELDPGTEIYCSIAYRF